MTRRVVVVGGGIGGAAAALHLTKAGANVILLERGEQLGGLVTSFEVGGVPLELAYHYLVPREQEILDLLSELDLASMIAWYPSTVAMMMGGRVWPFTGPFDLLRFSPLPFGDRIRTGIGALRLARTNDWEPLDGEPAMDWLGRLTSPRAREIVWKPLLRAKFGTAAPGVPAAWMWARMKQREGGRKRGREYLGYLTGGFRQMFEALDARLRSLGADIRTGSAAKRIVVEGGRVRGVELEQGSIEADTVLFTGPLPAINRLVSPEDADPRWAGEGLGVVCVILELTRPMTDAFWVNVVDEDIPFGGIIEHTNLIPASHYNGTHIAYLSRYYPPDDPFANADVAETAGSWIRILAERMPGFAADHVTGVHPFRAPYAAPLVTLGYQAKIPPMRSHIEGLYLSTTAQIYPQDRGMSEGVRMAALATKEILAGTSAVRDAV